MLLFYFLKVNPTSGSFVLKISSPEEGSFEYNLNNIHGKLIQKGTFNKVPGTANLELNIDGAPGMYFLRVKNGQQAGIIKIVKN